LLQHSVAKFENRIAADDPALALDYRQIIELINVYDEHLDPPH
jgi:hypothetical protein